MAEFETSRIYQLAGSVDYASGAVVSKMVSKMESGNITLFAFDRDQGLSEHSAPYDAFVQVAEGHGRIIIDRKVFDMGPGDFIIMPAHVPHAVLAVERFKMMLVMIKSAPLA